MILIRFLVIALLCSLVPGCTGKSKKTFWNPFWPANAVEQAAPLEAEQVHQSVQDVQTRYQAADRQYTRDELFQAIRARLADRPRADRPQAEQRENVQPDMTFRFRLPAWQFDDKAEAEFIQEVVRMVESHDTTVKVRQSVNKQPPYYEFTVTPNVR